MRITVIPEENCIECNGVKYAYEMFEHLGIDGFPKGTYFKLINRKDGMITVRRFEPPIKKKGARK